MIKLDIINEVVNKTGITKTKAEMAVETVFESMKRALEHGDRIELRGFGVFNVKPRKTGIGRNPRTGAEVSIPLRAAAAGLSRGLSDRRAFPESPSHRRRRTLPGANGYPLRNRRTPAQWSADFSYYPLGDVIANSGYHKQGGRTDLTAYSQIRFPLQQSPPKKTRAKSRCHVARSTGPACQALAAANASGAQVAS